MIRVLHVMSRMAPGGTENQLAATLRFAHGKLWEAALCVLSSGWPLTEEVASAGVPVIELAGHTRLDPRRLARFRRLAREVDVIHSSLSGANAFARAATVGMTDRPAVVVSERGVETHRGQTRRLADLILSGRTDAYIGNSPAVTEFIRSAHGLERGDRRVFEIRNGLDQGFFYPPARQPPANPLRLIAVGRLVAGKRIDLIISLLPSLTADIDLELLVVGDGPERGRLERMATGQPVTFHGNVADRTELADLLRSCHLLVMPSASEGLPNAVLEALACGLRVIGSDVPGMRAASGPGVTLIRGREAEWARMIRQVAKTPRTERFPLGNRAGTFEDVARAHLEVFRSAIQRSQGTDPWRRHEDNANSAMETI